MSTTSSARPIGHQSDRAANVRASRQHADRTPSRRRATMKVLDKIPGRGCGMLSAVNHRLTENRDDWSSTRINVSSAEPFPDSEHTIAHDTRESAGGEALLSGLFVAHACRVHLADNRLSARARAAPLARAAVGPASACALIFVSSVLVVAGLT